MGVAKVGVLRSEEGKGEKPALDIWQWRQRGEIGEGMMWPQFTGLDALGHLRTVQADGFSCAYFIFSLIFRSSPGIILCTHIHSKY